MKFVEIIDTLMAAAAPAPWTYGRDPCHFDAAEVRNTKWAIYVPTDQDARLIAALHSAWPAIRSVLLAAREEHEIGADARGDLESALALLENHDVRLDPA